MAVDCRAERPLYRRWSRHREQFNRVWSVWPSALTCLNASVLCEESTDLVYVILLMLQTPITCFYDHYLFLYSFLSVAKLIAALSLDLAGNSECYFIFTHTHSITHSLIDQDISAATPGRIAMNIGTQLLLRS